MKSGYSSQRNPAGLFLELYIIAGAWSPEFRSAAPEPKRVFVEEAQDWLRENDPSLAYDGLKKIVDVNGKTIKDAGEILAVMRAVDSLFYQIHPRALRLAGVMGKVDGPPTWLRAICLRRWESGDYAAHGELRLVPRGPLLRGAREEVACCADSLADRFSALSVVPTFFKQEDRLIKILHQVLPADIAKGIEPSPRPGFERVAFIPIAENANDLTISQRTINGNGFVEFSLSSHLNPAKIVADALRVVGRVDIALGSELAFDEKYLATLPDELVALGGSAPRILVSGSGATAAKNEMNMAWNEACVFNKTGALLWKQRKMWPAGMEKERAQEVGLTGVAGKLLIEDNAAGDSFTIIDSDTMGRCAILICQDLHAMPVSQDFLTRFQPDWIFSPILDTGIAPGRWAHARALELSSFSRCRFLISSSTTLADLLGMAPQACGLALGPKAKDSEDFGRQYKLVFSIRGAKPAYGTANWRDTDWSVSTIG